MASGISIEFPHDTCMQISDIHGACRSWQRVHMYATHAETRHGKSDGIFRFAHKNTSQVAFLTGKSLPGQTSARGACRQPPGLVGR